MNTADAEEYTQSLGQIVAGSWRQIALAQRLDVPKALGLTTRQWVEERLGGYVRLSIAERREAVAELIDEGMSQRQIADVLGVTHTTVDRDSDPNVPLEPTDPPITGTPEQGSDPNVPPSPLDTLAALAAHDKLREEHDRQLQRRSNAEANRLDDWYTPRWLFDQLGVTFDLDVCAPVDPAYRTVPAHRYYTQEDDGLEQPWSGLVWCNPPYSAPQLWMERWARHDNGMLLSVISAKTGRMAPHWRSADRLILFAGMIFDRPDGGTEAPYLPLSLAARGPAADLLTNIDHKWAGPVLERVRVAA